METETNTNQMNEHVYFINQLYRDFLFPEILDKENTTILYWAGKRITRHYDLESFEDLVEFFNHAEFGHLEKTKERRTAVHYILSGQTVEDRLNSDSKEFSLEAGMIAEAMQKSSGRSTECEVHVDDKNKTVELIARFD